MSYEMGLNGIDRRRTFFELQAELALETL